MENICSQRIRKTLSNRETPAKWRKRWNRKKRNRKNYNENFEKRQRQNLMWKLKRKMAKYENNYETISIAYPLSGIFLFLIRNVKCSVQELFEPNFLSSHRNLPKLCDEKRKKKHEKKNRKRCEKVNSLFKAQKYKRNVYKPI